MVLLAVELYQPAGDWLQKHSQLTDETAHLLSFVSIAVVVYLLAVAARLATHRRMQRLEFGSLVENVGGAFAGVIRMTVIMAWVTVVLSLTNNEFLQRNVSGESRFGSFVVAQLPALQSVEEKTMPKKMWLLQDLKRPPDPNYEMGGTTDTNTNRPQAVTP
jgi:hypothetical protein